MVKTATAPAMTPTQQRHLKIMMRCLRAGKDRTLIVQRLFSEGKFSEIRELTDPVGIIESGKNASLPGWVPVATAEKIKQLVKNRPKIRRNRKLIGVLVLLGVLGGIAAKFFL